MSGEHRASHSVDVVVIINESHIVDLLRQLLAGQQAIKALIEKGFNTVSPELSTLKAQVDKNTSIEESAVTLIQGMAAQMQAAKEDPAAIQALADELNASASDLSAAIQANTAPPPAPAPTPEPAPAS